LVIIFINLDKYLKSKKNFIKPILNKIDFSKKYKF